MDKKVKGRKRHIVTDTIGIPLGVKVTDANVSDNQVAIELLKEVFSWQITIQLVCADAGYRGWRLVIFDASVSIGHRSTSWAIGICGRPIALDSAPFLRLVSPLTLDYERSAETAEAMVYIASIYLMRNRIK